MIAMQLDLPLIFMALMGLAILAYVILDGFSTSEWGSLLRWPRARSRT